MTAKDNEFGWVVKGVEHRAQRYLDSAPRCDVCHGTVAAPGRTRHYLCDNETAIGKPCTCREGCSVNRYGDGQTRCDPQCVPCRILRGQMLRKRTK